MNNNSHLIHGNLFNSSDDFIIHQTNCVNKTNKGLSDDLFKRYPFANVYSQGKHIPGSIKICGNGNTDRYIIALFGQYNVGKFGDSGKSRLQWFKRGLDLVAYKLKHYPIGTSIGFPFGIGCGISGGNWSVYYDLIKDFSISNPSLIVNIYKLN
jgi:hypothetical protein